MYSDINWSNIYDSEYIWISFISQKWFKMVIIGPKWFNMSQNNTKYENGQNSPKQILDKLSDIQIYLYILDK